MKVFDMRVLVFLIVGLLVAGNAAADRDRDRERGGYHGKLGYSEVAGSWRKSARHYKSARLNYLRTSNLNSGVCDELQGSSRSLRMMCIAFCELQSCSPDFTAENPFESCSRSSKWIYNRYQKKRGAGDPDLPCVKQPVEETAVAAACPCWSSEELAQFRYQDSADYTSCSLDGGNGTSQENFDNLLISSSTGAYTLSLSSFGSLNGVPTCAAFDDCSDGSCLGGTRMMEGSAEQISACEADIAFAAAQRGIACN